MVQKEMEESNNVTARIDKRIKRNKNTGPRQEVMECNNKRANNNIDMQLIRYFYGRRTK